jgi:hypothetical protein
MRPQEWGRGTQKCVHHVAFHVSLDESSMESGFVILAAGMLDADMKSFTEASSWQAAAKGSGPLPYGRSSVKRWLISRYLRNRAR